VTVEKGNLAVGREREEERRNREKSRKDIVEKDGSIP